MSLICIILEGPIIIIGISTDAQPYKSLTRRESLKILAVLHKIYIYTSTGV